MNDSRRTILAVWVAALLFLAGISASVYRLRIALGDASVLTGWTLFTLIVMLALFNVRKKLSMLPLGSAKVWLLVHAVGGTLAVVVFWFHTGVLWPAGLYEQALAFFFYLITINGLAGYALQRIYPPRLTETGLEVIYERIPDELAAVREKVESLILNCTRETGMNTLAKHYLDTLEWFFRRPRFFASHALGGEKASHWIRHRCATVRRYLNQAEVSYLEQIAELGELKNKIDYHYAAQSLMKGWLLVHVPLAAGLVVTVFWHVILVHIYAL